MQPEQPAALSPAQAPEDGANAPAVSEQSETPSRTTSWLRRLWRGRGAEEEENDSSQEPSPAVPASAISLTQEEFEKRIQAETDRRENKRRELAQLEHRRKLRDEDPYAYAEQDRQFEQRALSDAQVSTMFSQIGAVHDRYSVDPLVQSLPEAERQRILSIEGAGSGLDGRKLIVEESLKALEKIWRAEGAKDAEDRLRKNPAFRKQLLGEVRKGMSEPEFVSSGAPSAADKNVSDILRSQLRARQ